MQVLCWSYRAYLENFAPVERRITEVFYPPAKYEALMGELAHIHARPRGIILLARQGGTPVGCGMTQPLDDATAEIKRVYVSDAARGHGAGRRICLAAMERSKAQGYAQMVLDTTTRLTEAIALYERLGFAEIAPFYDPPEDLVEHLRFYGRDL